MGVEDTIEQAQESVRKYEGKILRVLAKRFDKATTRQERDCKFDDIAYEQDRQITTYIPDEEEKRIKRLNGKDTYNS